MRHPQQEPAETGDTNVPERHDAADDTNVAHSCAETDFAPGHLRRRPQTAWSSSPKPLGGVTPPPLGVALRHRKLEFHRTPGALPKVQCMSELIQEARQRKLQRLRHCRAEVSELLDKENKQRELIVLYYEEFLPCIVLQFKHGLQKAQLVTATRVGRQLKETESAEAQLRAEHELLWLECNGQLSEALWTYANLQCAHHSHWSLGYKQLQENLTRVSRASRCIQRALRRNAASRILQRYIARERRATKLRDAAVVVAELWQRFVRRRNGRKRVAVLKDAMSEKGQIMEQFFKDQLQLFDTDGPEPKARRELVSSEASGALPLFESALFELHEPVHRTLIVCEYIQSLESASLAAFEDEGNVLLREVEGALATEFLQIQEHQQRKEIVEKMELLFRFDFHISVNKITPWWILRSLRCGSQRLRAKREVQELAEYSSTLIAAQWKGFAARKRSSCLALFRKEMVERQSRERLECEEYETLSRLHISDCRDGGIARHTQCGGEQALLLADEEQQRFDLHSQALLPEEGRCTSSDMSGVIALWGIKQATILHQWMQSFRQAYNTRLLLGLIRVVVDKEAVQRSNEMHCEEFEREEILARNQLESGVWKSSAWHRYYFEYQKRFLVEADGLFFFNSLGELANRESIYRMELEESAMMAAASLLTKVTRVRSVVFGCITRKAVARRHYLFQRETAERTRIVAQSMFEFYEVAASQQEDATYVSLAAHRRMLQRFAAVNFEERRTNIQREEKVERYEIQAAVERFTDLCAIEQSALQKLLRARTSPLDSPSVVSLRPVATPADESMEVNAELAALEEREHQAREELVGGSAVRRSLEEIKEMHSLLQERIKEEQEEMGATPAPTPVSPSPHRSADASSEGYASAAASPQLPIDTTIALQGEVLQKLEEEETAARRDLEDSVPASSSYQQIQLYHSVIEAKLPSSSPPQPVETHHVALDAALVSKLSEEESVARRDIEESIASSSSFQRVLLFQSVLEAKKGALSPAGPPPGTDTAAATGEQEKPADTGKPDEAHLDKEVAVELAKEEKTGRKAVIASIPSSATYQQIMLLYAFIEASLAEGTQEQEPEEEEEVTTTGDYEAEEEEEDSSAFYTIDEEDEEDETDTDSMASVHSVLWV